MSIKELQQRIDSLEQWKSEHMMDYAEFKITSVNQHKELMVAVGANTAAMSNQTEEMKGLLQLYRDAIGVVRIGKGIQQFTVSITKWGIVGTGSVYLASFIKDYFMNLV